MKTLAIMALAALLAQDRGRGRRPRQGSGAEEGKPAPNFKLKTQDGKKEVELAKLKGKPTVLVFGSWT